MDPVLVGQFQQGGVPHRTGEMQVQMSLGQLRDLTYVLHSRILPHAGAVSVALSLNVVLLARRNEEVGDRNEEVGGHEEAGRLPEEAARLTR
ncbi:hypothetical protein GCM10010372_57200 [Streptomyces tauricus]|nr:hypothetical protein GCM10010372_57200 [Streptomyces tauricus]